MKASVIIWYFTLITAFTTLFLHPEDFPQLKDDCSYRDGIYGSDPDYVPVLHNNFSEAEDFFVPDLHEAHPQGRRQNAHFQYWLSGRRQYMAR